MLNLTFLSVFGTWSVYIETHKEENVDQKESAFKIRGVVHSNRRPCTHGFHLFLPGWGKIIVTVQQTTILMQVRKAKKSVAHSVEKNADLNCV